MKTAEIMAALAERYTGQEWAFMPQVRDETGYAGCRTADGIAFNLWPSRGLEVIGFEVKASRTDWLRELKDPAKAEGIFSRCDRWYLVVGDATIVKAGELPKTWGLMIPKGRTSLVVKVEAPALKPKPFDRANIAAVMRQAKKFVAPKLPKISDLLSADAMQNRELGRQDMKPMIQRAEEERDRLRKAIADFEAASGIRIDGWNAGRLGEAVKLIEYLPDLEHTKTGFDRVLADLRRVVHHVEEGSRKIGEAIELQKGKS